MARASLADQALKAANGDPITALNAAVTVTKLQRPDAVELFRRRALKQRKAA